MKEEKFRSLKEEIDGEYNRTENILEQYANSAKQTRNSYLAGIGSALFAIGLTAAITLCPHYNRSREPVLSASTNPNAMVWSNPGDEYQARNFKDAKPFGSLDEVVLRTQDRRVVTLNPNDNGFKEQERVYKEKIVPMYE